MANSEQGKIIPEDLISKLRIPTEVSGAHSLATSLLETGLNEGGFERSVGNCHTEGVDSVVLFDRNNERDGMVRFYYAKQGLHKLSDPHNPKGDYTVGIHNHRYNLPIIPLFGDIVNVSTEEATGSAKSQTLHEYRFQSALKGEGMHAVHARTLRMKPHEMTSLSPGSLYQMESHDLHTIMVPENAEKPGAAWMVIEGVHQKIDPVIYSPRPDLELADSGLYVPMPRARAIELAEFVYDLAKRG